MNELDKPNNTDLISEFKHTLEQKYEQKQDSQMFKPDGEIRQCNEGLLF